MYCQWNFSHSRFPEPVLGIAILSLRKHQIQSQNMHFSKIFWGACLQILYEAHALHFRVCIGEPMHLHIETLTSFDIWPPLSKSLDLPCHVHVTMLLQILLQCDSNQLRILVIAAYIYIYIYIVAKIVL